MGTLEDIDRDYSNLAVPEEELLDLHGNEENAMTPPLHIDHIITLFPPYQVRTQAVDIQNKCTVEPFYEDTFSIPKYIPVLDAFQPSEMRTPH